MNEVLIGTQPVAQLAVQPEITDILIGDQVVAQLVVTDPSAGVQILNAVQQVAGLSVSQPVSQVLVANQQVAQLLVGTEALAIIEAIGSDDLIAPREKKVLVPLLNGLLQEAPGYIAQAAAATVSSTAYAAAVAALSAYLDTLTTPVAWDDPSGTTTVDGDTLRSLSSTLYDAKAALLKSLQNVTYRQDTEPTGGAYGLGDRWIDTSQNPVVIYAWDVATASWQRVGAGGQMAGQDRVTASYDTASLGPNLIKDRCFFEVAHLPLVAPYYWQPGSGPDTAVATDTPAEVSPIGASRGLKIPTVGGVSSVTIQSEVSDYIPVVPGNMFRLSCDLFTHAGFDGQCGITLGTFDAQKNLISSLGGFGFPSTYSPATTDHADHGTAMYLADGGVYFVQVQLQAIYNTTSTGFVVFGNPSLVAIPADTALQTTTENMVTAATTDIGGEMASLIHLTGSATITSFGTTPNQMRVLTFDAGIVLTHNATSLILPGAHNLTTQAGDTAIGTSDASGNWTIRAYQRASGKAVVSAAGSGVEDPLAITSNGQTAFTMSVAETNKANVIVHVGGAYVPTANYTVSGTTLTYTGSLPLQSGDTLYVRHAFNL